MLKRSTSLMALVLAGSLAAAAPVAVPALQAAPQVTLQSFAPVVKAARPAVVTVQVEGRARPQAEAGRGPDLPPQMRDFLERFGQPLPEPERGPGPLPAPRGVGSGFIVEADGIIVTNNHVVEGADSIRVVLDDGRAFEAELLGRDSKVDLAVLKVEAEGLPTLDWGKSDTAEVGDWAMAIGNPFGLGGTVTTGIISARGRDIGSGPYDDFIQVDAAINKGNSGGPLLDLSGKVIGVNTAIFSPTGGNVGLGFAIPAAQAEEIVADLVANGSVARGWIGVRIQGVTEDIADSLGLDAAAGALVAEVTEGSPAEAAGLRAGDVILGFGGAEVAALRDLTRAVADAEIGEAAALTIWRAGARAELAITPALLEDAEKSRRAEAGGAAQPAEELLGLKLLVATADVAEAMGLAEGALLVAEDGAGLRAGDVLLSANQTPLSGLESLREIVEDAKDDKRGTVLLQIARNGAARFATVPIPVS